MQEIENPFPGIRSFEPEDSDLFFGRENQIKELIKILFARKFVAVLGASGSGKSSLVKAGLIPSILKHSATRPSPIWTQNSFRPCEKPLQSLAFSLYNIECSPGVLNINRSPEEILDKLCRSESGLLDVIREQNGNQLINRLIYVDQFEEIFRNKPQKNADISYTEKELFISLLLKAIHQSEIPVFVIFSLRADFLGECTEFTGLAETINSGTYLVPRMTETEKRLVITQPIASFKKSITKELIDRLITDSSEQPDQLLVLQHALMRTWNYWKQNSIINTPIDIPHYEAIGTMHKALSLHGEQIYNELTNPNSRETAKKIFKALTNVGLDRVGVRRPTSLEEICEIADAKEIEVIEVIDKFREAGNDFLSPKAQVYLDSTTIIDIAHESIVKIWDRAREWVIQENKSAEIYLRLSKSAELYLMGKTGILRNPDLDETLKWQQQTKPNQTWANRYDPEFERAMNFLNESKKEFELEIRRKDDAQKRKLRNRRITTLFLSGASIISIISLIVAIYLGLQSQNSEKKALEKEQIAILVGKEAEEKRKEAISQKIIAEQQQLIAEEQKRYALIQKKNAIIQQEIAIEQKFQADAAKEESHKRRKETELALIRVETEKKLADSLRVKAVEFSDISQRLRRLAIAKALAIKSADMAKTKQNDDALPGLLALQAYSFNKQYEGNTYDPDIFTALFRIAADKKVFLGHKDFVKKIIFKNNETIVSCSEDGTICEWDLVSGKNTIVLKTDKILKCFAYLPDQHTIVAGCSDGSVIQTGMNIDKAVPNVITRDTVPVKAIYAIKTGQIIIAWANGRIEIRNNTDLPGIQGSIIVRNKINTVSLSADNKFIAIGCNNGSLELSEINNLSKSTHIQPEGRIISTMNFSNNGKFLAVANYNNEVSLWNLITMKNQPTNLRHSAGVNKIVFSPQDDFLASCSYDNSIKISKISDTNTEPLVIDEYNNWIFDIAFSPDGKKIAACGKDKTVRVWTVDINELVSKIKPSRNLTTKEWNQYVGADIKYEKTVSGLK